MHQLGLQDPGDRNHLEDQWDLRGQPDLRDLVGRYHPVGLVDQRDQLGLQDQLRRRFRPDLWDRCFPEVGNLIRLGVTAAADKQTSRQVVRFDYIRQTAVHYSAD